jgi:hypothetical protein
MTLATCSPLDKRLKNPRLLPNFINSAWMLRRFARQAKNGLCPFLTETADGRVVEGALATQAAALGLPV